MTLNDVVWKYQQLAGDFGASVALKDFGLSHQETEDLFSQFDEDYNISRFFHFTFDQALEGLADRIYRINAFQQSHVALDREIAGIL